jgi:hypothetical protein
MGSLVQLGDVPAWINTATSAASLYLGLRNRHRAQALDFARVLEQLAGLSPEKLRRTVEDNPVIAQMVDLAWEEAARTASEDKRRLLAKVVAAAMRGDADAEIDHLPFLLRAVMALDPAHVTLLAIVATPRQAVEEGPLGALGRAELLDRWTAAEDLLDPALAALEQQALIGIIGPYGSGWWTLRPFGRRFFDFLHGVDEAPWL